MKRTLTDAERIASIREVIEAARGDWHEATALWSIGADLNWLLDAADALATSPAPDLGAALRDAAQAVVDSVHGVQYGTSTPRLPVTAESPVHWQVSGAAIDALRAALAQPDGES